MVKKKGKSSNNKGGMDIKKILMGVIAIVIAIAFAAYENKTSVAEEENFQTEQLTSVSTPEKKQLKNKTSDVTLENIQYELEAHPVLIEKRAEQLISHKAYHVSYNKDFKVPNWVFYELTQEEINGRLQRSDNFQADPAIKYEEASHLEDYRHTGWDRGHMAPSMDMNWDPEILDESYLLSNMCPQGHDFNAGIWLDLEHEVRYWAKRDSAVCVVCGPILPKNKNEKYRTLPQSKVIIPEAFFKIVFAPFAKNGPRAIAFVMPNEQRNETLGSFAVTIDSVEALTGIDFFPILPDDIEDAVESSVNVRDWLRKKDI